MIEVEVERDEVERDEVERDEVERDERDERDEVEIIDEVLDDDFYYIFGDYIYKFIKPEINEIQDLDMFKYILGKIYFDFIEINLI